MCAQYKILYSSPWPLSLVWDSELGGVEVVLESQNLTYYFYNTWCWSGKCLNQRSTNLISIIKFEPDLRLGYILGWVEKSKLLKNILGHVDPVVIHKNGDFLFW